MPSLASPSSLRTLGALALLGLLAACATPEESALRYDTTRENTQTDARDHVMGERPRAASQIQLGFGSTDTPPAERAQAAGEQAVAAPIAPRPLAEPRSFLGTVPCPSGMTCEAARFVVTLAPSGEWRSRTQLLVGNQVRQTLTDQGCWDVIGDRPLRIALVQQNRESAMADMTFVNDNSLRVNMLHGAQPMLEHRLSRQADLDPIDELKDRPAIACA
ncbi:MAG TPA: hypothetical protein VKZ70_04330 [Burkholderiaceae bacterium]|nr:hypothetical protein [Burkholderiaceae bacterium]